MYRRSIDHKGLTLVELMIAVAIIAIVAAVLIPDYLNQQPFRQLNTTGRDIYAALQMAKVEAARRNANVVMEFIPGAPFTSYRIFLDNGTGVGGVAGDRNLNGAEPILLLATNLPQGVMGTQTFAVNGAGNGAVGFTSRVLPTGIGTITLNIDADGNGVADLVGGQATYRTITVTIAGGVRFDDRAGTR